jgi:hypothetical protein
MKNNTEKLPSVVPVLKTVKMTYDIYDDSKAPAQDDYMVSIGKKRRVTMVHQVVSCRPVKSKVHHRRYSLQLIRCPELIPQAHISFEFVCTVNGMPVYSYFRTR